MSNSKENTLINIYHNSSDVNILCKALAKDLNIPLLYVAWKIHDSWTINKYDTKADPCLITATKTTVYFPEMTIYEFSNSLIAVPGKELSKFYLFIIEAYVEKLRSQEQSKKNKDKVEIILSNICHSIRTPLNGILHMTTALEQEYNKEYLSYLKKSAVLLTNNVLDIIDMTQLHISKFKVNKELVSVRELIDEVLKVIYELNTTKHIEHYIENSVPDFIYSDAKRIKQIIMNLLQNGTKYAKDKVYLYVYAMPILGDSVNQYHLVFSVSDNGPGIDSTKQENLATDLFINYNPSYGMGLKIAYGIAKKLGGNLRLKDSNTLEFSLDVCEEEPPAYDSNTLKLLSGKKALVIDELNDKIAICKILEKYQIEYQVASTFEEVFLLYLDKKYDLVVCVVSENLSAITQLKQKYGSAKFMGVLRAPIQTRLFDETTTLPLDEATYKNKLVSIFDKKETPDLHLLIVEDEQINRIVLEKLLRYQGYTNIDLAINGEEAFAMIQNTDYDMLLIDIRMPVISGFELADMVADLYKSKGNQPPAMIGITAQMVMDDEPRSYFNTFIYKPIDIKLLDRTIKSKKLRFLQTS